MTKRPHKPVTMPPWRVEASEDSDDAMWRSHPERKAELAKDTALLIIGRVSDVPLPEDMAARIREFVDEGGLDDLAHVWADSPPGSLPGALWRLYRVREQILAQPDDVARLVSRGLATLDTIDPIIAGLDTPITTSSVLTLIDTVFFGAFEGDVADALSRVGALSVLMTKWAESN